MYMSKRVFQRKKHGVSILDCFAEVARNFFPCCTTFTVLLIACISLFILNENEELKLPSM